jgi:hypothetical protein
MPLAVFPPFSPEAPRSSFILTLTWSLAALATIAFTGLQAAPEKPGNKAKEYALFMGLDVSFDHNSASQALCHVSGSKVRLIHGSKTIDIPIDEISDYRLVQNLKLSPFKVTIDQLDTQRTYSRSSHPMQKWGRAEILMMDARSNTSQAHDLGAASNSSLSNNSSSVTSSMSNGLSAIEAQKESEKELFNALEVSFEISSEHPLNKAYVVVVTEFGEDSKPSQISRSVSIRALAPFSTRKQKVSLVQSGLPEGFKQGKTSVHVYSEGKEFATNLSKNRIDLTRVKACEYLILQYLTANKGKSLPPSPALMPVPKDIREHIDAAALERPIYVKVNKLGTVKFAYTDEANTSMVDPYVESVLDGFNFTPALENGIPIPGSATIKLSDYVP